MKSLYLLLFAALVIALSARLGTAAEPDAEARSPTRACWNFRQQSSTTTVRSATLIR